MQTVSPAFNALANGDVRPHSWGARISFTKDFDDAVTFFTLNSSVLDGIDILGTTEDNPIQAWDYYDYDDFTERIIYISVTRELEFPYSVVSSIADFQLNNYDKYFTPNSGSPIDAYILPKRPVRLLQGLSSTILPQFVGLTQGMPELDRDNATATFTALDFLTQIYSMPIRNTIAMADVYTGDVLIEIFTQFGLTSDQYDIPDGRNFIPFLFFEKNQQTAGEVIRPLMQAEGGALWLDEQGIIRFRPRLEQPSDSVYTFDSDNIVSLSTSEDDQIINHVIVNAQVRELQEFQIVYSKSETDTTLHIVPAGGTYVFSASLQDPCLNIQIPMIGEESSVSWFVPTKTDGTVVSTGVTVTATETLTNSYEITFSNANAFPVDITQLTLWGQPGKQISLEPTVYDVQDTDSIEKYEDQTLSITNNLIQSFDSARSLGLTIIDEYSEFADVIEIEVKGNPALQLSDIFDIDFEEYTGEYRIISISNKLQDSKYTQIIKGRKYTPRHWFTLDQSVLDGSDVLAP